MLIDSVGQIPNSLDFQMKLCRDSIEWCIQEKRTFLKQRIESRLASLLLQHRDFKDALRLISSLSSEVKKIDDKLLLVEISIVESKVHQALQNVPKAKAALTSARAASNAIYCPPLLQAQIDEQAGTLCSLDKDYKTAFSYFFEAFESYNLINETQSAIRSFKYMLLTKIMMNTPGDVFAIIAGKSASKISGIDIESMKAIAEAYKKRSLYEFKQVLEKYKEQLVDDPTINSQLNSLYENLVQQNLLKIIEPYSRVQLEFIAKQIDLPLVLIQQKLSEMILDKKFHGILDQGAGDLIIYDEMPSDDVYIGTLSTIDELTHVVNRLYSKSGRLSTSNA